MTFAPQLRAKVRRVGAFLLCDRFYQGIGKGAAVDTAPNPHQGAPHRLCRRDAVQTHRGMMMVKKILTATAASLAMLSAAAAADLPRREPPPPAPAPVGKAPIGKFPVGKYPPPQPVVTKG